MVSVNQIIVAGNITQDLELLQLESGTHVCNFSVAVNEKFKKKTGEVVERVDFFNCVAFQKTAVNLAKYMKKGSPILVQGKLQQDRWEDKETGKKRSAYKVIALRIDWLGTKAKTEGNTELKGATVVDPNAVADTVANDEVTNG